MVSFFYLCFLNSINIALFITLLALIQPCLKKYLSAVCLYRLWIVLLLGLFLPIRAADNNALFYISLPRLAVDNGVAINDELHRDDGLSMNETIIPQQKKNTQDSWSLNNISQSSENFLYEILLSAYDSIIVQSLYLILFFVWCIGLIILIIKGIRYHMYLKHLKRFIWPFERKEFMGIYQQCFQELNLYNDKGFPKLNKVSIYQCSVINSPMTIGILRPIILLPNENYTKKDFYFSIKHELIHIRRKDSVIKLMRLIILSFYWYNPFCFVLSRRLDEWCEASCDELVLRNSCRSDRLYYGKLLLRFAMPLENKVSIVNMIGGKKYMKNRLISIVENRRKRPGNIVVLMVALIVFTITIVAVNHGVDASASNDNEVIENQQAEPSVSAAQSEDYPDATSSNKDGLMDKEDMVQEKEREAVDTTSVDVNSINALTPEALRETVVEYAVQALSTPYIWGGNDLSTGVDSSGLVQAIYKKVGYQLPRTSRKQASEYDEISLDSLKPGDLIFYGDEKDNLVNHVAIYIGEQKVIHASNLRDGVKTSDYDYRPIISAGRVITD